LISCAAAGLAKAKVAAIAATTLLQASLFRSIIAHSLFQLRFCF
jgi:hypothetical protein